MNYIRKLFVLLFFFGVCVFANAGIVEKLLEEGVNEIIRPYSSIRYVGTLYTENCRLKISFESDTGYFPTIMAYKIADEEMKIIIKSRRLDNNYKPDMVYSSMYFLITLFLEDDKIKYVCYWIEDPYIIADGFTFNDGKINEKFVNVRLKPSTKSGIFYKLPRGSIVRVTSIGKNLTAVVQMLDFWFEVEINREKYWIYGYYIDFFREILLK